MDDGSTDGTAAVAKLAAERVGRPRRLTVVSGLPLPPGWTGKLWSVSQGITEAEKLNPDYFLLTDADIRHSCSDLMELIEIAEVRRLDLASYMVRLASERRAERLLIPAFVFFFLMLYPPAWTASGRFKTAGAAGGCILIRRSALERIGGVATIRNQLIDDCALARAVKRTGGRVWMGLSRQTQSIRSYESFREIGRMISRTAFHQLRHSAWLLAIAVAGLFFTYLLPPMLLFTLNRTAMICGGLAWMMMTLAYFPIVRFYGRSWLWSLLLPLVALFYLGATVHSAVQYWRGRGGNWKGRVQDVRA